MTFNLKQCALVCGALALAATSAAARTVVDDNGTSVEIPDHVNRVVVTNILPLASAVTVFLNDGKTVVGMHPASYSAAKSGLLGKLLVPDAAPPKLPPPWGRRRAKFSVLCLPC